MNISKKWRAAAAGAVALALVGTGAVSANAADDNIKNPQSNGSQGSFYVWDGNTGEFADYAAGGTPVVYTRDQQLIISGSATDVGSEIEIPAGTQTPTSMFRFIAKPGELSGGKNTWRAYNESIATGPTGGLVYDTFNVDPKPGANNGGIESVFTEGGDWLIGVAFTINNGVTPVASIYRTMHVDAAADTFWLDPVEVEGYSPNFDNFAATAGAKAEIRNSNLNIDATAANAGKTVDVWVEGGAAKVATVTLDASGKAINTIPAGVTDAKRLAIVENKVEVAWITTTTFEWTQPTDAANAATKKTIVDPVEGETVITIDAGIANAGKQFSVVGWSTPTQLENAIADASGVVSIDTAALGYGAHTVALFGSNDEVAAWGTFTTVRAGEADGSPADVNLSVDAITSNKFALEGVATSKSLGSAKRGQSTTPVDLGAFTVIDDRDALPGWNLTAAVEDFKNGNDVIGKAALGLKPKNVSALPTGVTLGAEQLAGSGVYSMLFAEGGANSSTLEAGTQFDAGLQFAVPASAKKGTYTSKLTFTLVSK